MSKLNINSKIIEDELERQGKTELLEAFKAMVGCNKGMLFNSLREETYKYNDSSSDYYQYRQILIDEKKHIMDLVENLEIDATSLYSSFLAPGITHDFLILMQSSAKKLLSVYDNSLELHLSFQSALSSKEEILSTLKLIVITLRMLDTIVDDIVDMRDDILQNNPDPKSQMLSNYFSCMTEQYDEGDEQDQEKFNIDLCWSLAAALAFLEKTLQNPKKCIEVFITEGITDKFLSINSCGHIDHIKIKCPLLGSDIEAEENIVKFTCKELGLTQKELAEMLDVQPTAISNWASGQIPKMAQLALELLLENKSLKDDLNIIKKAHEILHR